MSHIPIRLNTLRPNQMVDFDVFIFIDKHYVHYIKAQDAMEGDRISKLKSKRLKKLWIKEEDETRYLDYLDKALQGLEDANVSQEEKGHLVNDSMTTEAENVERNLDSEEGYKRTEGRIGSVVDFFKSAEGALQGVLKSAGATVDANQHCSNVASLSLSLASVVGVSDEQEFMDLGIAALAHDIGKGKLGLDPLLAYDQIKAEDRKKFWDHGTAAVDMLQGKRYINPRVLALISNHEEVGEGQGFPAKKRITKLPKLSQVLNLCNAYDRFCMDNGLSPTERFDKFVEARGTLFIPEHIEALNNLVTSKK